MKLFLLKFFASALLIGIVFRAIDLQQVLDTILGVDPLLLLLTNFIFLAANLLVSPLKIKLLLRANDLSIPFPKIVSVYCVGMFFNRFLPGGVGGDITKSYDYAKLTNDPGAAVSAVLMERLSGVVAIIPIVLFCLVASRNQITIGLSLQIALLVGGLIVATAILLYRPFMERAIRSTQKLGIPRIDAISEKALGVYSAFNGYLNQRVTLLLVFLLSLLFYLLVLSAMWVLAKAIEFDVSISYFSMVIPLIFIIETIPISIGGIGVRESAYAYFFGLAGYDPVLAVSLSFLHFLLGILNSAVGGIVFALRRPL